MPNWHLDCLYQVNVEAELEGAAGNLGRMAVWDQIQASLSKMGSRGQKLSFTLCWRDGADMQRQAVEKN